MDLSTERRKLVLGGSGGIGKTQLAIAYARRHQDLYDSIFWLNATSSQALETGLQKLAQHVLSLEVSQHVDINHLLPLLSRWFSDPDNKRWLLIFDNYDEPDQYQISKYYPYASHGSIIITTRRPNKVLGTPLKLSHIVDIENSLQILKTRSGRQNMEFGK